MVTFLLSQFSSMTLSYFQFSIVTKIDILKMDSHISYYSVLKQNEWLYTFKAIVRNSSEYNYKNTIFTKLFNLTESQMRMSAISIEKLLNVLIKVNLTNQFHNNYPFYYNAENFFKPYDITNHIHQGYMVKDIYSPKRLTKFWTYNINRTLNKRIEVIYSFSDVVINLIMNKLLNNN